MSSPGSRTGIRNTDPPDPPAEVLARYGARVLDPATAAKLPDAAGELTVTPGRTVYVADTLAVPVRLVEPVLELLNVEKVWENVRAIDPDPDELGELTALAERLKALGPDGPQLLPVIAIRLVSTTPGVSPPDAWPVLLRLQAVARAHRLANPTIDDLSSVELQHLLFATNPVLNGTPGTQGFGGSDTWDGRLDNGLGGRRPVRRLGAELGAGQATAEVTVAIVDTAFGENAFFQDGVVPAPTFKLDRPAPDDAGAGREDSGDVYGPLDGLMDRCAGHNMFIAGIIRQICPSAKIMPIRVMGTDGVALQTDVIRALTKLLDPPTAVHIVVLSMGYCTEEPLLDEQGNLTEHGQMYDAIRQLGARGVAVVAAGGNDATSRPLFPAAFAANQQEGGGVPVLSVGALNLDGSVALFSNSGPWIKYWRCGVNVVSTFPTTFNGGLTPTVSTSDPSRPPRRGVDPDNFREGWGIWYGSSFSAPIVAGELASKLAHSPPPKAEGATTPAPAHVNVAIKGIDEARPVKASPLES